MLLHADDFTQYATTAQLLDGPYLNNTGPQNINNLAFTASPDPLDTQTRVLRMTEKDGLRYALPASKTTFGLAFRVWNVALGVTAPAASDSYFLVFFDSNGRGVLQLDLNSAGGLVLGVPNATDGFPAGAVLSTSNPAMSTGAFHHVEVKVNIHASTGYVEVRVDGIIKLRFDGNTSSVGLGSIATLRLGGYAHYISGGAVPARYFKDLVVWDTTGSRNNDWMGAVHVQPMNVTADVAMPWTPSTGVTGWNLIDDVTTDDSDYITAPFPAPAAAEFTLQDLPNNVTSVRGVVVWQRSRKTDGGDGNLQVSLGRAGSYANGTDRPLTTAFTYWKDVFEVDPVTGTTITPTNFNAFTLKLNRTL